MELSPSQRRAIEANGLQTSWQLLTPWLLRHLGTSGATAATLVDWLQSAADSAQGPVLELLRHMESRIWEVSAPTDGANRSVGLLPLTVSCGGLQWTLWLQRPPVMRVLLVTR